MRLVPVCLPLVLAPFLAAGQQPQPSTTQKPAQTSAVKLSGTARVHKKAARHKARHRSRKAAMGKRAQSTKIPVDVITGGETHHVVLDQPATVASRRRAKAGQVKVEVINGSAAGTQYFSDKSQENVRNQSVVVGVQSGDTRFAGGNKNPVVTGVTSSTPVDATSASSGGQPVAKQVSPRPKRPTYAPDQH